MSIDITLVGERSNPYLDLSAFEPDNFEFVAALFGGVDALGVRGGPVVVFRVLPFRWWAWQIRATLLPWLAAIQGFAKGDNPDGPISDQPVPPNPSTSITCLTMKTMLAGTHGPIDFVPEFHALDRRDSCFPPIDRLGILSGDYFQRQSHAVHWVLKPEVCLGPAHLSRGHRQSRRGVDLNG